MATVGSALHTRACQDHQTVSFTLHFAHLIEPVSTGKLLGSLRILAWRRNVVPRHLRSSRHTGVDSSAERKHANLTDSCLAQLAPSS